MSATPERRLLVATSPDGARTRLQLHVPPHPRAVIHWLPALGVGIGPNETLADALADEGFAVAIHEWRGLGGSDRRAGRRCDWGYTELLDADIPAARAALRETFPGLPRVAAGHSLGGQLALLDGARHAPNGDVFLVASGQPWWRAFPGVRAAGVRLFAHAIAPVTHLAGYFPGHRLGFAGREAGRLMREWAGTCLRGDYRVPAFGAALDEALARRAGRVLAIRMAEDRLAPPGAIDRLRSLTPGADWEVRDFGRAEVTKRRPDHFGWLRDPAGVVRAFAAWRSAGMDAAASQ